MRRAEVTVQDAPGPREPDGLATWPAAIEDGAPDPGAAYDGSSLVFRLLRAAGWGAHVNLGRFRPWDDVVHAFRLDVPQQRLALSSLALLDTGAGDRVLDVGCGRGVAAHLLALRQPEASVVGLDLLRANVAVAEALYGCTPNLCFEIGRAEALPFEASSFDRIHCLEAAFHFDRDRFLSEASRVLRPGGRLVVVDFVWRRPGSASLLDTEDGELVRRVWQFRDFWTADAYHEAAAAHGLRLVATRDWTASVTSALQRRFARMSWLCARTPALHLVRRLHPPWRGFSRQDWEELRRLARAHGLLCRATRYLATVWSLDPAGAG
jgi:SAM-dependent methyltransferase